jgi:nicotinate-nucleotide adenylyltransferase
VKRLGFFAGTFDPIHDGHVAVAEFAYEVLELEAVYFMVEPKPWSNKLPVSLKHRIKMVDLALNGKVGLWQLETQDDMFSADQTLNYLEKKFPKHELFFIFGADVFMKMNNKSWNSLDKLLKHYVVVVERKEITERKITNHAKALGIVVAIMPSMYPHHSSSDVRLELENKSMWIPKAVSEYIDQNNLYRKN